MIDQICEILKKLEALDFDDKVSSINRIREEIHKYSPFQSEPVDFVRWVKNESVVSNDYNPNKVAPTEMKLLELSIASDGYTQPIVGWSDSDKGMNEVIDGFHRHRVGKESPVVSKRVSGYLPIVDIRKSQSGKSDRMASTIRHNRARGKHQIDAMSSIVLELKNRNWKNSRIAKELGMDEEEVLRLCQISGMENLFSDRDFSRSWEVDGKDDDWEPITSNVSERDVAVARIPNFGKGDRIFHTFDRWECFKSGFFSTKMEGKKDAEIREMFASFVSDNPRFKIAVNRVVDEWKYSCEHYLTNFAMNRIAWLGQAAACISEGIPSKYCGGFGLLTEAEQNEANNTALEALNRWLVRNGRDPIDMNEATSHGRQVEIY